MSDPTTIIIFGITGDLAQKKILPALFDLFEQKRLPEKTQIIGFSRREFFTDKIPYTYVQGQFDDLESYTKLAEHLKKLDTKNKIFYLSVPPSLYEVIARNLSASNLSPSSKILVEKPFGSDLQTAIELDKMFGELFTEEQIYRIDHYLAKNTLVSLPASLLRFREKEIKRVEINLLETARVGNRGAFYDKVGALRDVGQNHMLQMLALIAMREEGSRAEVIEHLVPFSAKEIEESKSKRGQYKGYVSELGVTPESNTETFFSITVHIDIPKFLGVPFILTSGKGLDKNLTEITIYFTDNTNITFTVPPEDSLPAYQKIILDCIAGDQTVFTSIREVLAEWKFITPIVEGWKNTKPVSYKIGINSKEIK